jgi:hypothetical protein
VPGRGARCFEIRVVCLFSAFAFSSFACCYKPFLSLFCCFRYVWFDIDFGYYTPYKVYTKRSLLIFQHGRIQKTVTKFFSRLRGRYLYLYFINFCISLHFVSLMALVTNNILEYFDCISVFLGLDDVLDLLYHGNATLDPLTNTSFYYGYEPT